MNKKKFNTMLPSEESDNPNVIIKKDKKFLTIALIIGLSFITITMLTTFIVSAVMGNAGGVFLGIFSAVTAVVNLMITVNLAHNVSRQTAVVIKIAEKLLSEKVLPNSSAQDGEEEQVNGNVEEQNR